MRTESTTSSERLHIAVRTLRALRRALDERDARRAVALLEQLDATGVSLPARDALTPESLAQVIPLLSRLALDEVAVERRSEARRALPPGSTRARVTTANARWATACEARDRTARELRHLGVDPDARTPALAAAGGAR